MLSTFSTALIACATLLVAQETFPTLPWVDRPTGPPTFPSGDSEGLQLAGPSGQVRYAWKRKVFWKIESEAPGLRSARVPVHTAAERQAMTRTLDALTGEFKATPTGSRGEGFWVLDDRQLDYVDVTLVPSAIPLAKHPLQFSATLFPFYHEDVLRKGTWALSRKGETESISFSFNALPKARADIIATEPAVGDRSPVELYLRPRLVARFQDFPIYDGTLWITRAGRDPWAPVTMDRVLQAAIPLYEKDRQEADRRLADLKKKHDEVQTPAWEQQMRDTFEKNNGSLRTSRPSNYQARLASLENEIRVTRENAAKAANPQRNDRNGAWYWNPVDAYETARARLAALSPAEAARPACFVSASDNPRPDGGRDNDGRYAVKGAIVPAGSTPGCREIVETNRTYFDLTLPRTVPQVLAFNFGRCADVVDGTIALQPATRFDHPPQGCYQHQRMWNEADWSKIAALVRGR
jgi:hypothetical protein